MFGKISIEIFWKTKGNNLETATSGYGGDSCFSPMENSRIGALTTIFLLFLIFINITINNSGNSYANTVFLPSDDLQLEKVNGDEKGSVKNRYNNFNQVKNQYKNKKLSYIPNNGLQNFREGKFYTAAFFFLKSFPMSSIDGINLNSLKSTHSFAFSAGYYFWDFFAAELEYFEYEHKLANLAIPGGITGFIGRNRNFIINLLLESNYSKFMPFIGVGAGLVTTDFREANVKGIKGGYRAAYQAIIGFEIAFTDSFSFVFRWRGYYDTILGMPMSYNGVNHDIKFSWRHNFNFGLKYVW